MAILDFLKTFRTSFAELRNEVDAAEKQLELAQRRREELLILPPTRKEVIDMLCGWVRTESEKYPATLRNNLNRLLRERDPVTGMPIYGHGEYRPDILTIESAGKFPSVAHVQSTLAFFLKDVICAGIERAVKDMPDWKEGPSRAERVAEINRLDREIAAMEEKLRELAAGAAETGISITLSSTNRLKTQSRVHSMRNRPNDKGSAT